jgi:penicillin-binding protein 2
VNNPSYEPQMISGREINPKVWNELRESEDRPLRNRAIQDTYPPGSTFKLFLAIAALAEGKATAKSTINCNGSMLFGKRHFACWKRHGTIDFVRAIKESCDVYFYNVGLNLGIDKVAEYARMFGLGDRTGIKIQGEQRGLIPDSQWKAKSFPKDPTWQLGETLSVSIGQGYVSVTPLQMASAYAAIGNGGFVYRPYIVRKIERINRDKIEFRPELNRKVEVPSEVFDIVKEGLFKVVNEPGGTAFLSKSTKTIISGKTGTAQVKAFTDMKAVKCPALPMQDRHHGWFVGYAPRENPEIAVAVLTEHTCHGALAGHLAQEVIDTYFNKKAALNAVNGVEASDATVQAAVGGGGLPKKVVRKPPPVEEPSDDDE